MTTFRLSLALSTLAFTASVAAAGCSGSNDPATDDDGATTGGTTSTGTGGSTASGGTGGSTASGGTGGSTASGGTGTGGAATGGTGGTDLTVGDPPCELSLTEAGEEPAKGGACTENDPQLCWRKCGPQGVGWKSETCTGGLYAEGDCVFPTDQTYECFAIPETQHADCPTTLETMPQASQECMVPECNPCNVENQYKTSSGEVKVGYCVCQPPNSSGVSTWSCASGTAWPCPLGEGC